MDSADWDAIYATGDYSRHWDCAHASSELVAVVEAGLLPVGGAMGRIGQMNRLSAAGLE